MRIILKFFFQFNKLNGCIISAAVLFRGRPPSSVITLTCGFRFCAVTVTVTVLSNAVLIASSLRAKGPAFL